MLQQALTHLHTVLLVLTQAHTFPPVVTHPHTFSQAVHLTLVQLTNTTHLYTL